MANREVCEVYLEQEIEEELKRGETPYAIGKKLAAWVAEKLQEKIPERTIEKRAERKQKELSTNVENSATAHCYNATEENQEIKTASEPDAKKHGGKREGAGRPTKGAAKHTETHTVSDAEEFATMAMLQIDRIRKDDPKREKALLSVIEYCQKLLRGGKK